MRNILFLTLLFSQLSKAQVNFQAPEILARSNVHDSYNLPTMSYLSNVSPVINEVGEVAFKVIATGENGAQGIWVKAHQDLNGKILYTAPPEQLITDPSINDHGLIAFSLFDEMKSEGLFTLDSQTLQVENVFDAKKTNINFYTYPTINNKNEIFFRGTDKNNDRKIYRFDHELTPLIEEGVELSGTISSYLFKPVINQNGLIALKMRLGKKGSWDESNPDIIGLYNTSLDKQVVEPLQAIATDRDFNSKSNYAAFLNSVSLSNTNHLAFAALNNDGRIGIYVALENFPVKKIALENEDDILNIETFSVKVNNQGHVLFRGKNKLGKRCLFYYDGTSLKKLIGEGDSIETDIGAGKILDNQFYPGISGEIDLNDHDQIVFGVVLQNAKDNHEIGQAIYQLNPIK